MNTSKNQRMVLGCRKGSVTFWAWMVSISVHLTALTVLGIVRFSPSKIEAGQLSAPAAGIERISRFINSEPVIPKPKVVKSEPKIIASAAGQLTGITRKLVPADSVFEAAKPTSQNPEDFSFSEAPPIAQSGSLSADSEILPAKVEFFGSWTDRRKICYVVDCSGSMKGIYIRVRERLKESIKNLQPDQYFYIIFFGGDRLTELGDGRPIRATDDVKSAACEFVDLIRPAGQTNAIAAMERAVRICGGRESGTSVIYFLTDGFELTTEGAYKFSQEIMDLRKRFAPAAKINTIGFWPQQADRDMLQTIARQTAGEFVFVESSND